LARLGLSQMAPLLRLSRQSELVMIARGFASRGEETDFAHAS
jgi:hypothetical protein